MISPEDMKFKPSEIGRIKIGEFTGKKTSSGHNIPRGLGHFKITTTEKNPDGINLAEYTEIMQAIGKKPLSISIILPFDDPELCFHSFYALYSKEGCICQGDGLVAEMLFLKDGKPTAYKLLDPDIETVKAGEKHKIHCDPQNCPNRQPDSRKVIKCRPNGRLCCIIPISKRLTGFFFFRTTSHSSISYIISTLDEMKKQTGGILRGIPARLFFSQKGTDTFGNFPVVTIDWDFDNFVQFQKCVLFEMKYRAETGFDIKKYEQTAVSSGVLIDNDSPEDITSEFYPHNLGIIGNPRP